jgi:hypothetical protein
MNASKSISRKSRLSTAALARLGLVVLGTVAWAAAPAQVHALVTVPDAGGTAAMPLQLPYGTPNDDMRIIDGLQPDATIGIDGTLRSFFDIFPEVVGGSLGGTTQGYKGVLDMPMTGTGSLAGFHRNISIPNVQFQTDYGPRAPGTSPQSFDTEMVQLFGQLPIGDPDFDLLRVTAGTGFGMPSPGHTTLTVQPGGNWAVDSFFDITYRIDFVGHPGSVLGGRSGSTTATIRFAAFPEPSTAVLLVAGVGALGIGRYLRRRRRLVGSVC